MQNQLQTEEPQPHYQTPAITPPQELATQEATEQQQEQNVAEFVAKIKKRSRRTRFSLALASGPLALAGILLLALQIIDQPSFHHIALKIIISCLGVSLVYALCCLIFVELRGRKIDIEELAHGAGVRAIGPLIEMRNGFLTNKEVVLIYDTLTALLPRFKSSDANLLSRKHRDFLNTVLASKGMNGARPFQQEPLCLAILEAWKQVGDAQAIPVVRRLAEPPLWHRPSPIIQQAARECLPILEANLSNVLSTQTLLRAAAPEPAGTDTLLRPAASTTEHAPGELLRAANSDN